MNTWPFFSATLRLVSQSTTGGRAHLYQKTFSWQKVNQGMNTCSSQHLWSIHLKLQFHFHKLCQASRCREPITRTKCLTDCLDPIGTNTVSQKEHRGSFQISWAFDWLSVPGSSSEEHTVHICWLQMVSQTPVEVCTTKTPKCTSQHSWNCGRMSQVGMLVGIWTFSPFLMWLDIYHQ